MNDRLAGLVVKASASGVEDLVFKSHLWWDFSQTHTHTHMHIPASMITLSHLYTLMCMCAWACFCTLSLSLTGWKIRLWHKTVILKTKKKKKSRFKTLSLSLLVTYRYIITHTGTQPCSTLPSPSHNFLLLSSKSSHRMTRLCIAVCLRLTVAPSTRHFAPSNKYKADSTLQLSMSAH